MKFKDIKPFTIIGGSEFSISVKRLPKWIEEQKEFSLELNPDFQRGHVWTTEQQQAYVEYFLRKGKSGKTIYFNYPSWQRSVPKGAYDDFVCVDGLQRMTSILKFINNELPVFGGKYYNQFEGDIPHGYTFKFCINDLRSKKEVLKWYLEMNSGGTPHSEEELNRVTQMFNEEN